MTKPADKGEQPSISANAPAWTPGGVATDVASPIALPRHDQVEGTSASEATAPGKEGGSDGGESSSVNASESTAPQKKEGGETGDSGSVTVEPTIPADELNS